jgi:hypothetical protein
VLNKATERAVITFVPPAYFDASATIRRAGSNLATALACPVGAALAIAMLRQAMLGLSP